MAAAPDPGTGIVSALLDERLLVGAVLLYGCVTLWRRLLTVQDAKDEQGKAYVESITQWRGTLDEALRTIERLVATIDRLTHEIHELRAQLARQAPSENSPHDRG